MMREVAVVWAMTTMRHMPVMRAMMREVTVTTLRATAMGKMRMTDMAAARAMMSKVMPTAWSVMREVAAVWTMAVMRKMTATRAMSVMRKVWALRAATRDWAMPSLWSGMTRSLAVTTARAARYVLVAVGLLAIRLLGVLLFIAVLLFV
jgi:hypothetical protein